MKTLNLLIVEDDSNVVNTYESNITSYNRTIGRSAGLVINPVFKGNSTDALSILKDSTNDFDCAIVDLDLKNSGGSDASGNEVIREIKEHSRFPIFVISGTAQNIEDELAEETSFFKIRNRDDQDFDYLDEMVKIYNTGITSILKRTGKIEEYITTIFWKHISSSLEMWVTDDTRTPDLKEKSLLRYTLLHLQEYLDIPSEEDSGKYHPAEFLITKPIKESLFTGDIIEYQEESTRYIVLTPACDFQINKGKRKAEKVLLIRILNPTEIDAGYVNPTSKKKKSSFLNILGNSKPRYHTIPKSNQFEIGIIDFQDSQSIELSIINEELEKNKAERLATVSQPFLKDIIERYSSYFARQGSPDFDSDELYNSLFSAPNSEG